jgi:peptidyl-prolyl cis-trans isomerase A (cyclophilin A)
MIRALIAIIALVSAAAQTPMPQQNTTVVFETEKGTIEMEINAVHAPGTAANFLKYVDAGFYDGGTVNRSVRPDNTVRHDVEIQVIQFQIDAARRGEQFPPIPIERTTVTGLRHVDGALSMARSGPDTATGSFSIVIGDQPEMNFGGRRNPDGQGFAVFGRVTRGMDVVKAIQASPTGSEGPYGTESLMPPIKIVKAYRRNEPSFRNSVRYETSFFSGMGQLGIVFTNVRADAPTSCSTSALGIPFPPRFARTPFGNAEPGRAGKSAMASCPPGLSEAITLVMNASGSVRWW